MGRETLVVRADDNRARPAEEGGVHGTRQSFAIYKDGSSSSSRSRSKNSETAIADVGS